MAAVFVFTHLINREVGFEGYEIGDMAATDSKSGPFLTDLLSFVPSAIPVKVTVEIDDPQAVLTSIDKNLKFLEEEIRKQPFDPRLRRYVTEYEQSKRLIQEVVYGQSNQGTT